MIVEQKWSFELPSSPSLIPAVTQVIVQGIKEGDFFYESLHTILKQAASVSEKIEVNASTSGDHFLVQIKDEGLGNRTKSLHERTPSFPNLVKAVHNAKGNEALYIFEKKVSS